MSNKLHKILLSTGAAVSSTTITSGTAAYGVHCFGGFVWIGVGNGASSRLVKFDPVGATFTAYNIGLNVTTNNVSICDDGTSLFVASQSGTLIKVNPTTGAAVWATSLGFAPYGAGCDGTYVYVGGSSTILGDAPYKRAAVCKVSCATGVASSHKAVATPAESNWKYDGRRFMYAWGSPILGGLGNTGAVLVWDTQLDLFKAYPVAGTARLKAVEPVGDEVWGFDYYRPHWLRFVAA